MIKRSIQDNSRIAQSQEEYLEKYNSYVEKYEATKERYEKFQKEKEKRIAKAEAMTSFIKELKRTPKPIKEFDDTLWRFTIDKVVIEANGDVRFFFYDGEEVTLNPWRKK